MPRLFSFLAMLLLLSLAAGGQSFSAPSSGVVPPLDTITVNSTVDAIGDDGLCTLRDAITAANTDAPTGTMAGECPAGSGDDTIIVPTGHYVLTRVGADEWSNATGDLNISSNVTIQGYGIENTILDGNGTDRVIGANATLVIVKDLTITNGRVPDDLSWGNGGGIAYWGPYTGQLVLRRVAVQGNHAGGMLTTGSGGDGGGIFVAGKLYLQMSEVSGNWAGNGNTAGYGGGIYLAEGDHNEIWHSTISGNHTYDGGRGGGIAFHSPATVRLSQVTVANNSVGEGSTGEGGGIHTANASVHVKGVLLTGNRAALGSDCAFDLISLGGNVIGDNRNCTLHVSQESDHQNIDPLIKPLQDNGGNGGWTHALQENSPAIDQGNCEGEPIDQRGFTRPVDMPSVPNGLTTCDVGSHENQVPPGTATVTPSLTPNPITPSPTPTFTPSATTIPTTTLNVNSTFDTVANDGQCTLREAVTATNTNTASGTAEGECRAGGANDLILLPAGYYFLTRYGANEDNNLSGDLDLMSGRVTIRGAGSDRTVIDGMALDRVIQTRSPIIELKMEDVTVTDGRVPRENNYPHGGGIDARERLVLRRVVVRNNRAAAEGPTSQGGHGGGIYIIGDFWMEYSEISENAAGIDDPYIGLHPGSGGGIYAIGMPNSEFMSYMSTISGNWVAPTAPQEAGRGGGVAIESNLAQTFYFISTTIANNEAQRGGGIGAVYQAYQTDIALQSSILADNISSFGANCNAFIESHNGNVIDDITFCGISEPTDGDQFNVDPLLGELRDNGSGRRTHALANNSPAIDHGLCTGESTDQRGYPRPINHPSVPDWISGCDVGAYELNTLSGTPTVTVTPGTPPPPSPTRYATNTPFASYTATPTPTPLPSGDIVVNYTEDVVSAGDGRCSLREAITAANSDVESGLASGECAAGSGDDLIILPGGTYYLARVGHEDNNDSGDLDIRSGITLLGEGATTTIIDAQSLDRVIHILPGASTVTLRNLTFTHGLTSDGNPAAPGGGLLINAGVVTLSHSYVVENQSGHGAGITANGGDGGGIALLAGQLTLSDSEIRNNQTGNGTIYPYAPNGVAGRGGGLFIASSALVARTTIDGNSVGREGSGNLIGVGGGIHVDGALELVSSTVSHNSAYYAGGIDSGVVTITNSTISGNSSYGLYVGNNATLKSVTIADNVIGMYVTGNATLENTVVDGNETPCIGTVVSLGYNLFGVGSRCAISGDMTGTYSNIFTSLAPLVDNGGSTYTHSTFANSPARDKGRCDGITSDQRGFPRPSDLPLIPNSADGCDIGAYEEQAPPVSTPTPTVTPTATATLPSTMQALYLPLIRRSTP